MGEFLARNAEALVRSIGVHLFYTLVSVAIGFVLGLGQIGRASCRERV